MPDRFDVRRPLVALWCVIAASCENVTDTKSEPSMCDALWQVSSRMDENARL